VTVDVAYGGMFYVIADASQFGLTLAAGDAREIVRIAELVKTAAQEQLPVSHPENPRIAGVSIAELTYGQRNAVVVSTKSGSGVLDRSPCGTGTCARMAVLHAKGKLGLREDFVHEGILGTKFVGRLVEETKVGEYDAVVPTLSGQGWITGFAQYVLDPEDPFPEGFTVGDIW
jgi:proline racemase